MPSPVSGLGRCLGGVASCTTPDASDLQCAEAEPEPQSPRGPQTPALLAQPGEQSTALPPLPTHWFVVFSYASRVAQAMPWGTTPVWGMALSTCQLPADHTRSPSPAKQREQPASPTLASLGPEAISLSRSLPSISRLGWVACRAARRSGRSRAPSVLSAWEEFGPKEGSPTALAVTRVSSDLLISCSSVRTSPGLAGGHAGAQLAWWAGGLVGRWAGRLEGWRALCGGHVGVQACCPILPGVVRHRLLTLG